MGVCVTRPTDHYSSHDGFLLSRKMSSVSSRLSYVRQRLVISDHYCGQDDMDGANCWGEYDMYLADRSVRIESVAGGTSTGREQIHHLFRNFADPAPNSIFPALGANHINTSLPI